MKKLQKDKAIIIYDEFQWNTKKELRDFVGGDDIQRISEVVDERFYLVLGGDGTMLRAIQSTYKDNLPYLGINFGSKGFLLNERGFTIGDDDTFKTLRYPLLEVEVDTGSGKLKHVAFNEVQIKTAGGHMIDLNLVIGGHSKIRMKGDGMIIVTPAGSTGYNISAGGPVLPHNSPTFLVTPLLCFEPRNLQSIPFESAEHVIVTNNNERGYELSVYADSIPVIEKSNKDLIVTVRRCKLSARLLIANSDINSWKSKIYREQGFESEKP